MDEFEKPAAECAPVSPPRAVWKAAKRGLVVYGAWTGIHYAAAHLYPKHCAPGGLEGLIMSTFLSASPQCIAIRWCINKGSAAMISMWVVLGSWCASHLAI